MDNMAQLGIVNMILNELLNDSSRGGVGCAISTCNIYELVTDVLCEKALW